MALAYTSDIGLGFEAPQFSLLDVISGNSKSFKDVNGSKGTVVMFICNHCPYVVHVREELIKLANYYLSKDIGFVAISSNDVENYPDDSPELMKDLAKRYEFPFPYLYDESQNVAKAYDAACTPDYMIFDKKDICVYRGRLDDSSPGNGKPVTGADMRTFLDSLVKESDCDMEQFPSCGCNIKWKQH